MPRLTNAELAALPEAASAELRDLRELETATRAWARAKSAAVGTFTNPSAAIEARQQWESAETALLELLERIEE